VEYIAAQPATTIKLVQNDHIELKQPEGFAALSPGLDVYQISRGRLWGIRWGRLDGGSMKEARWLGMPNSMGLMNRFYWNIEISKGRTQETHHNGGPCR
jgi:hypothetical protein